MSTTMSQWVGVRASNSERWWVYVRDFDEVWQTIRATPGDKFDPFDIARRCLADMSADHLQVTHKTHKHETIEVNEKLKHKHELGAKAVLLHICGDAVSNLGVVAAGTIMWQIKSTARFYADPAISTFIALMILVAATPLGSRLRDSLILMLTCKQSRPQEWSFCNAYLLVSPVRTWSMIWRR